MAWKRLGVGCVSAAMRSGRFNGKALVAVVIPAHNEEASIAEVIADIPRPLVGWVAVGANACTDRTEELALEAGAIVAQEPIPGYGRACVAAIAALPEEVDVLVFVDGDYADDPSQIPELIAPILEGRADAVIGSRVLGRAEPGSLLPQQRLGNALATAMISFLYGHSYTDLGPFRAITRRAFEEMKMEEMTFGWTVELQVKALQLGYIVAEVPVRYRKRIGTSKISGTVRGVIGAGYGIIGTILKLWWRDLWNPCIKKATEPA